jgi:protein-S-isoprenylcysteine O-methyltransferase Ste14
LDRDTRSQEVDENATAGVIARPPFLFLSAVLLGHAADHLLPHPYAVPAVGPVHGLIGTFLITIGLGLAIAGIRNLSRADTPVQTYRSVRVLVTSGIHGRTRNPIYLGMFLTYSGIGLSIRGPWLLLLLLPLAIAIRYGVVTREEAYLERRFGDAYRSYKSRVRRWL